MMFWYSNKFYSEKFKNNIVGAYRKGIQYLLFTFLIQYFRHLTVPSFGKQVYSLQYLSRSIISLFNSLPWKTIFSMSLSFLTLVNLTITSADVCRVNKHGNNMLYLILIAPLYIEIQNSFQKNCFAHSFVPSPSDFLLAMFELIVNFL